MASADRRTTTDLGGEGAQRGDLASRVEAALRAESTPAPAASQGPPTLIDRLFNNSPVFDFFQAVRLLYRLLPNRATVGGHGPPDIEAVRFRALVSDAFPASSIYEITRPTRKFPLPAMTVTFLGLTGPSGVLPRHYTELLATAKQRTKGAEAHALRDWLDLFNHRFISLFYRAWEKYRFWLPYEREDYDLDEPDTFTTVLLSFAGLGTPRMRSRLRVTAWDSEREAEQPLAKIDDLSLIFFVGLLAGRPRNVFGLAALLGDYFGLPVEVKQFQGQWLQLEPDAQSRLGTLGGNCELGMTLVCGQRVWDAGGKFRIRLGPLPYERFVELLPDYEASSERKTFFLLVQLVTLYVGPDFDFDVQLLLRGKDVPPLRAPSKGVGARLGWNTWLTSRPPTEIRQDVVLDNRVVFCVNDAERQAAYAAGRAAGGV